MEEKKRNNLLPYCKYPSKEITVKCDFIVNKYYII